MKIDTEDNQEKTDNSILSGPTKILNNWTGENKSVPINFKEMFSEVFKPHSSNERDQIFISGTKQTTPSLTKVADSEVKPWLFSRIFVTLAALIGILYVLTKFEGIQENSALLVLGAMIVPFTLLIFFFEINVFKDISIYQIIKIFFIGGAYSLITTLLMYTVIGNGDKSFLGSLVIGFAEETGKALIVAYFIKNKRINHIFSGLLIGVAVGAGFAFFENIEYADKYGVVVLLYRIWRSLGSHAIWTGIIGAAMVMAKGNNKITWHTVTNNKFLRFYFLSICLHAVWDMDFLSSTEILINLKHIILIIIAWIVIFVFIHAGLRQVKNLKQSQ